MSCSMLSQMQLSQLLIERLIGNMKLSLLIPTLLFISCNSAEPEVNRDVAAMDTTSTTDFFKLKLIVILSRELEGDSKILSLQDYIENGTSYIPVFTSKSRFTESTKGADIGKQIIAIDGMFLLSLMQGGETLRVNPGLPDERTLLASDLIARYKVDIDSLKRVMRDHPR